MEPPIKRIKTDKLETAAAAHVAETEAPYLGLELICHAAFFASTAGNGEENDLQNIFVAVGRNNVAILRRIYLLRNLAYLRRCLRRYVTQRSDPSKCRSNILAWMEINKVAWKEACHDQYIAMFGEVSRSQMGADGEENFVRPDPLAIFNNPACAIEFGLVEVLKYLVEEKSVDINTGHWNSFQAPEKGHLIATAMRFVSEYEKDYHMECLDYLLTVEGVDIHQENAFPSDQDTSLLCIGGLYSNISSACYEALTQHKSFSPNKPVVFNSSELLPLHTILLSASTSKTEIEKMTLLLEAGADPALELDGFFKPIQWAKHKVSSTEDSDQRAIFVEIVGLMEEYISGNNNND